MDAAHDTRWLFVGAGNMASALVGGLLAAGTDAAAVTLVDTDPAARERARCAFGAPVHADLDDALDALDAGGADAPRVGVVLAVKPPGVVPVCAALARHGTWRRPGAERPFVVSIAAGVRIGAMARALDADAFGDDGATAIVRAMPNTPSLVGMGAAGVVANAAADARVRAAALGLFEAVGTAVALEDEGQLDAVTALSGSGPAYALALIEHMAEAGAALGLAPEVATRLGVATVAGAGAMAAASEESPGALRVRVTSPGGTTAAALDSLERDGLAGTVARAMRAAHARAVELGDDSGPDG